MFSFPFLVWVRMTFACIIPGMFLSEFELAPNIVITSLFYLNTDEVGMVGQQGDMGAPDEASDDNDPDYMPIVEDEPVSDTHFM